MLKLNAFLKEKNVRFSLKRKVFLSKSQNNSVRPTEEIFISTLSYNIEIGLKLDNKKMLMSYLWF